MTIFFYHPLFYVVGTLQTAVQPAFLDKLSATIQQQRRQLDSTRASTVRDMINAHAQVRAKLETD
jgi:hypothetical protein